MISWHGPVDMRRVLPGLLGNTAKKGYLSQVGKTRDDILGRYCYEASRHFDSHCMHDGHECPVKTMFDSGNPAQANTPIPGLKRAVCSYHEIRMRFLYGKEG
jgi:hypothetical protein